MGDSLEVEQVHITINNNNILETYSMLPDHVPCRLAGSQEDNRGSPQIEFESEYEIMRSASKPDLLQTVTPEPIYHGSKSNPRSICLDFSVHSTKPKATIKTPAIFSTRQKKPSNIYDKIQNSSEELRCNKNNPEKKPTIRRAIKNFVKKFGFKRGRKISSESTSSTQSISTTVQDTDSDSYTTTKKGACKRSLFTSSVSSLSLNTISKSVTSRTDVTNIGDVMSPVAPRKPSRLRSKSAGHCTSRSETGTTSTPSSDGYCKCHCQHHQEVERKEWCHWHHPVEVMDWDNYYYRAT